MPSEVCSDGICVLGQVRPVTENICFDGVFRSAIKAAAVTRAYQAHPISGRQSGRRTAAEIDGTDFAASLTDSGSAMILSVQTRLQPPFQALRQKPQWLAQNGICG
ncbi:TPA: hypothetical protein WIT25_001087 [Neisseria meningitidis]